MQDLKIYIVIQDPNTKQDVNITGNFEVLRAFLSGVGSLEIQAPVPTLSPLPVEVRPITQKRKSEKEKLTA